MSRILQPPCDISMSDWEESFVTFIEDTLWERYWKDSCLYYQPQGENQWPDFVLYSKNTCGIIICEVKDWSLSQIINYDGKEFTHNAYWWEEKYKNDKYRTWQNELVNLLNKCESDLGKIIPSTYITIFPNIERNEFDKKFSHQTSLKPQNWLHWAQLFKEDLEFIIWTDEEKYKKLELIKALRYYKDINLINSEQEKKIRYGIDNFKSLQNQTSFDKKNFHQMSISIDDIPDFNDIIVLDKRQEYEAKRIGGWYRFIEWIAWSGKTVILLARLKYIKDNFPWAKLLLLCHNSSLKEYFSKIIEKNENMDIFTFSGFWTKMGCSMTCLLDKEWQQFWEIILDKIQNDKKYIGFYDYIFVDEWQDFYPSWWDVIYTIAKGEDKYTKQVMIAFDDSQDCQSTWIKSYKEIFSVKWTWRVTLLSHCYRTTKQIGSMALKLFSSNLPPYLEGIEYYFNEWDAPKRITYSWNYLEWISAMNWEIRKLLSQGYKTEEICIILPSQIYDKEKNIFSKINEYKVITKTTNYSKWLEYRAIFLARFDELENTEKNRMALYVAITRAKEKLYIIYNKNTPWVIEPLLL